MSSSSVPCFLAFGVEMELLIKPKVTKEMDLALSKTGWNKNVTFDSPDSLKKSNRKALRTYLATVLTENNIPAGLETKEWEDWTVLDERSLDEVPGYWRVELVSKSMTTEDAWQVEIDSVFAIVREHCDITLTTGCSMHVHVSTSPNSTNQYTLPQLKSVSKGVSYFDDAITRMMPADRKNNPYAASNVQGEKALEELASKYKLVPTESWETLFRYIDGIGMKPVISMKMGVDRYMAWNFTNIMNLCGTVEFRLPPGVKTPADAKHWASFALGFIASSLTFNWNSVKPLKKYPTVSEAVTFINSGVRSLHPHSQGALLAKLMKEDLSPPTVLSHEKLEQIKRLKAEKNKKLSPFAEKANSRPNTPTSRTSSPSGFGSFFSSGKNKK